MDTEILSYKFNEAYGKPTSGSQGAAILKILYEDLPQYEKLDPYKALEGAANVLVNLGKGEPHPWLYGQVCGAWDKLLDQIERLEQLEIDQTREQDWYIVFCYVHLLTYDSRLGCPQCQQDQNTILRRLKDE